MIIVNRLLLLSCAVIFSGVATAAYVKIENNFPHRVEASVHFVPEGKTSMQAELRGLPPSGETLLVTAPNGTYPVSTRRGHRGFIYVAGSYESWSGKAFQAICPIDEK